MQKVACQESELFFEGAPDIWRGMPSDSIARVREENLD